MIMIDKPIWQLERERIEKNAKIESQVVDHLCVAIVKIFKKIMKNPRDVLDVYHILKVDIISNFDDSAVGNNAVNNVDVMDIAMKKLNSDQGLILVEGANKDNLSFRIDFTRGDPQSRAYCEKFHNLHSADRRKITLQLN